MTVAPLTLADLTEAKVNGTGAFDTLMRATVGHLELEFDKQRLRGADYAQVYLSALTPILQNAVVFLLQKDEAANKANLVEAQIRLVEKQILLADKDIAFLQKRCGCTAKGRRSAQWGEAVAVTGGPRSGSGRYAQGAGP